MRLLLLMLIAFVQANSAVPGAPVATISNVHVRASMYLPDAKTGYYRGTRFDWSGAVSSLTWNGHEYFGQWFERYDPTLHDAITGPVEEFLTGDSALGYAEAAPGGTFIRIGVGVLRKPAEPAFQRFHTYAIVSIAPQRGCRVGGLAFRRAAEHRRCLPAVRYIVSGCLTAVVRRRRLAGPCALWPNRVK